MDEKSELGLGNAGLLEAYKEHCGEIEYRIFAAEFIQTEVIIIELTKQLEIDAPPGLDTEKFHERTRKNLAKVSEHYNNMQKKMRMAVM